MIYGALPPKTDLRDYEIIASSATYPDKFSLNLETSVKNQGSVNSCVAHAMSTILEYYFLKEMKYLSPASTDFIYGMQGVLTGRTGAGMYLRDACKIAQSYGDVPTSVLPTNTEMPEAYDKARTVYESEKDNQDSWISLKAYNIKNYAACRDSDSLKHALINYGPVMISIRWYTSYSVSHDGVVTFDKSSSYGCHAVVLYGYDDEREVWICQNSWGSQFGINGAFFLPYEYDIVEAYSMIDDISQLQKKYKNNPDIEPDVFVPTNNGFLDSLYKFFNWLINLFKHNSTSYEFRNSNKE